MFHFNEVRLSGTLTRDPEVKHTPKGTAVAQVGLAINRVWKNDAGEKIEETTFIDCEAWGRTAEVIGEYTKKGHTIFIEGRLKLDQFTTKEGEKRSKLKVVVERMHFVSKPKDDGARESKAAPQATRAPRDPDLDPDIESRDSLLI